MKSLTLEKLPPAGNASRETHLKRTPSLRRGDDALIAAELEAYICDAERGALAIIKVGFFLECIAEELPHGQLGPWVEAHCQGRSWRTVQRWKQVAESVGDAVGVPYKKRIPLKLHEVLSLPIAQVPEPAREVRRKIDDLIAGKTYRQLFLDFKQTDDTGAVKRGNLSGRGCTREHRAAAAIAEEQARLEALTLESERTASWLLDNADNKRIGSLDDNAFLKLFAALDTAIAYMRPLAAARRALVASPSSFRK